MTALMVFCAFSNSWNIRKRWIGRKYRNRIIALKSPRSGISKPLEKTKYRKIPIISTGLIFIQKAFLLGLFSGELIFGETYFRRGLLMAGSFKKWVSGIDSKDCLKH